MKKKVAVLSAVLGTSVASMAGSDLISYNTGKVSSSRNILVASADKMTCGKEMKEKMKQCRKMMEEAKCGSKMKECKALLKKQKEGNCGAMNKTKKKAKEMVCGQCGAMK